MQWPTSQPLFFQHRPRSRRGATFTSCSMVPSQWLKVLMLRWVLLLRLNIRYLFNEIIVIYSYFIHIYEIYHSDFFSPPILDAQWSSSSVGLIAASRSTETLAATPSPVQTSSRHANRWVCLKIGYPKFDG